MLVDALHEPHAVAVDEEPALAADRLADEGLLAVGGLAEPEDGGVELDELDVGHDGARAQRDGHPVAGRDGGVGRGGVELAEPAGREDDGPSVSGADPVDLALADDVDRHAAYPAVVGLEQVHDERVLDHLDARVGLHAVQRLDQGPADLAAGGVAAGVGDPVTVVSALAGQQDLAGRVAVELRTQGDELTDPLRSLGDEGGDRLDVAEPDTGHEGVAQVLLGRVRGVHRRGDAALRPCGRTLVEDRLGDEQDRVDLLPEPQSGGQPGDARPDDDDVDVGRPARRWGVEPTR